MTKADLERICDLALTRLATGNEPPWVWYQLMKLREASEALMAGMDVTQPMADLRGPEPRRGAGLRLVAEADRQDSAQPRPDILPVRLPT
jgi:hypothetical protein